MRSGLNERLAALVQQLDAAGPAPSLAELSRIMSETPLSSADVAAFIHENPRSYNRAQVAIRDHYELLVMTWRPGQSSVPHDHAGSICAMQIVQGTAVEGSYRVAPDGFVDLEYESEVGPGQVTAGQDAGVHTVLNRASASEPLVTVHVYAPPLKDFRRFIKRPSSAPLLHVADDERVLTVVVVGGGFSGSMAAAQLLRRAAADRKKLRVIVVERRGNVGEGVAYSSRTAAHLLNVPAGRMSAWPDRPDDFVRWVSRRYGEVRSTDFLPRQWYGEYTRETLVATAQEARPYAHLSVLFDEVRRVARHPAGGWLVHLGAGASLRAVAVVLAVGHRPPTDPFGHLWTGPRKRLIADPWQPFATNAIAPEDPVVILGSGLTAVDTLLSLHQQPRTGPVTLISRRGLLPHGHAPAPAAPVDMQTLVADLLASSDLRALKLSRRIRSAVAEAAAAGTEWRCIIDGLRPHIPALWTALPTSERRRFVARLRPFWEIHRHRMATSIAEQLRAMQTRGDFRIVAGRIAAAAAEADHVHLTITPRLPATPFTLHARWVINCTGPTAANHAAANPAIGSLLVDSLIRPDTLGLGIDTTPDGHAISAAGHPLPDLFIVGTLRKPATWESTAVPELRTQAATAAEHLLRTLPTAPKPRRTHDLPTPPSASPYAYLNNL
jgi:uncharacterized NAD(P)/FAD-binding protein YdhS/predicted metal-dependent enzyme (double-stranded beta helix superfamily)